MDRDKIGSTLIVRHLRGSSCLAREPEFVYIFGKRKFGVTEPPKVILIRVRFTQQCDISMGSTRRSLIGSTMRVRSTYGQQSNRKRPGQVGTGINVESTQSIRFMHKQGIVMTRQSLSGIKQVRTAQFVGSWISRLLVTNACYLPQIPAVMKSIRTHAWLMYVPEAGEGQPVSTEPPEAVRGVYERGHW